MGPFGRLFGLPEGASEQARIAHPILCAGTIIVAVMYVASIFLERLPMTDHASYAVLLGAHLTALLLLHWGLLRTSILFFVGLCFVSVFRTIWVFGGLHVPAFLALPPAVLFVGLTWSGRASVVTAVLASSGVLCFWALEQAGLLPSVRPVPLARIAVYATATFVLAGVMLSVAVGVIERSRAEAATSLHAQRELEERLSQASRMELVGRLAAGVAHDFNNLLTVIYAAADGIEQQRGEGAAAAATIIAAAERASALTRQLLTFGRRHVVVPERLNLNEVVGKLLPLLVGLLGQKAQLECELGSELPALSADRTELEQILLNLVTNARDALTGHGTVTVRTGIAAPELLARWPSARPGHPVTVYLSVQDTGVGMDPQTKARLFEPFFTTKEPGRGTGLGLPTVHDIAERMGGAVLVDTEPGSGTTFTILFPVARAAALEPGLRERVDESRTPAGQHVLVIDDDAMVRESLVTLLRAWGYSAASAQGASDALAMADAWTRPPDLLLVDVVMPEMRGPDLVRVLRQRFPRLKAMFMSGYAEDGLTREGNLHKDVHFVAKPLLPEALCSAVARVLASPNIGSLGTEQEASRAARTG